MDLTSYEQKDYYGNVTVVSCGSDHYNETRRAAYAIWKWVRLKGD